MAADTGEYLRVGELGPNSSPEELNAPYTLREVVGKARAGGRSAPVGIGGSKMNPKLDMRTWHSSGSRNLKDAFNDIYSFYPAKTPPLHDIDVIEETTL